MPRILDNIEHHLATVLRETLALSHRADFCVGYFNLRGWKLIDEYIEAWPGGEGASCRLLVGMQALPQQELRAAFSLAPGDKDIDQQTALRLKKKMAETFREQLALGAPTNADEAGLRRLAAQIKAKKVAVKLFLRHHLHAKLYLLFRRDPNNPATGFVGSSNLTMAGLSRQGELNVDVLDHDACQKLGKWFDDRWDDKFCLDISEELAEIIGQSWAGAEPVPPHHIYVKMAYHLAQEARAGLSEFRIPSDFRNKLFEFQKAAVKIAAHHLNKRGGVLIGDVVGLGKTLMATALAKIFEDDQYVDTLIVCPKNLVPMWEDYRLQYRLHAKVVSLTAVQNELRDLRRFRLVLIDESHNLRNREGKRYRALLDYIQANDSMVVLLSATPYNKSYLDLSNQLRLFIPEDADIGIRPERLLRDMGELEFIKKHQCPVRSLQAFERSEYADDWRDLMRLYLVRRTRSFIRENYAKKDEVKGRQYLEFQDGTRSYFPDRVPKTLKFRINEKDPQDQYAKLFAPPVVQAINALTLPRYGLGNYQVSSPSKPPTTEEARVLQDLSRAGVRLKGFCRTGLFKRLESSGHAFLLSVERHVLRNFIYLHAVEQRQLLPIGTQDMGLLDTPVNDADSDLFALEADNDDAADPGLRTSGLRLADQFKQRAAEIYKSYAGAFRRRFKWLRPDLFAESLAEDLARDSKALIKILGVVDAWDWERDEKLKALFTLVGQTHPAEKILVFSQFADTVDYLESCLKARKVKAVAAATGESPDPFSVAWHFSPVSNGKREQVKPEEELRVVVATDVLSEGQNLQDCSVVVNFDLPWAIIRLIQRAGRVDRIGQKSDRILCYSFLPADGVERIINLRRTVRRRLKENAEVVGADEQFFDDDRDDRPLLNLYNEKAGILDGDDDTEVDLASYAYQIWKNAIDADPKLATAIPSMPNVVFSTRAHVPAAEQPEGALVFLRTADGNDALAWVGKDGKSVTESQFAILKAAECKPGTPAIERHPEHHDLVRKGVDLIVQEDRSVGGQLGRPSGARFRTYERMKQYLGEVKGTLFESPELVKAIDEIYRHPLLQVAVDTLNRQLKSGIDDEALAQLVMDLREDGRLCRVSEEQESAEPHIICSLGLRKRD